MPSLELPYAHEQILGRPSCPRCGERLDVAEATKVSDLGHVRHDWRCDGCTYEFGTTIALRHLGLSS